MKFSYSARRLKGEELKRQRLFEILPGAASWFFLLGLVVLSKFAPLIASIFIMAFLLAWVMKLFYLTIFLIISYARLSTEKNTNWFSRLQGMTRLEEYFQELEKIKQPRDWAKKLSFNRHLKRMRNILDSGEKIPAYSEIYHLIIVPVASESQEVIEADIASLARNKDFVKQMFVVLALEARAKDEIKAAAHSVVKNFQNVFFNFTVIEHPDCVEGEARVKGANSTFAARDATRFFEEKKISFENIIVSCFDSDTIVGEDYFACLTYSFLTCPNRLRASFQPIPVFHNNIWEVPGFARVIETGSSFFQLIETTDPERLVTFSSHSMSFKALVDVGFWPIDMISDDSAIFWKSYLHYDGEYQVVPLPTTISMDVVDAGVWWKTVISLYKQKRRWAWGVENFPITMRGFLRNPKISFYNKFRHALKMFDGHVTWAVIPFFLMFIGWVPAMTSGGDFANTVLYYNAGRFTQIIFGLSTFALAGTILMSILLLPRKKKRFSLFWTLIHGLEWFLVPFILVFLSAMPALDAQTRLMLGKRMEFWVSDKRRG